MAGAANAPQVRRLVVDEGSEGQRLDNFLLRVLKGVPKTHVYRVIRSGEVRVNKGRAALPQEQGPTQLPRTRQRCPDADAPRHKRSARACAVQGDSFRFLRVSRASVMSPTAVSA